MSPRSASVNEELRRRSKERLLQAAVELVGERGFEATTLGDIADRAGSARGLVSYYFPGKRQLVQSAVHRLMHRTLEEALEREPRTEDGRERMARAIDAILGLARDRPVLMRQHMAGLLQAEGFLPCPEQRRLAELLRDTVARHGSRDVDNDYPMLRALLMGAVYAALVPGVPMPVPVLRAELFKRYRLDWELGIPPEAEAPDGPGDSDLSRFFATGTEAQAAAATRSATDATGGSEAGDTDGNAAHATAGSAARDTGANAVDAATGNAAHATAGSAAGDTDGNAAHATAGNAPEDTGANAADAATENAAHATAGNAAEDTGVNAVDAATGSTVTPSLGTTPGTAVAGQEPEARP